MNLKSGIYPVHYLLLLLRPPLLFPNVVKDVVTGGFFRMLIIVLCVAEKWIQLF
jgi:hypothetical protein